MLFKGGRLRVDICNYVQDSPVCDKDQLALGLCHLGMQAAHNTLGRYGMIKLHKGGGYSLAGIAPLLVQLTKAAALVGVAFQMQDFHSIQWGGLDLHGLKVSLVAGNL